MRTSLRYWAICIAVVLLSLIVGFTYDGYKEQGRIAEHAALLTGGDPQSGRDAAARYGCGGCHDIPGVVGAHGLSAPPLTNFGARTYIAGELRNTPDSSCSGSCIRMRSSRKPRCPNSASPKPTRATSPLICIR